MNRLRTFRRVAAVLCALPALAALAAHASAAANPDRPNILFILADDLGWGDLSCYGNTRFKTPGLDRLAREGTLFTQFYQGGSVCSPARATLLTGRWPAELRIHGHFADPADNARRGMVDYLDPALPTLPRLLRTAGYRTAHVGKWHLGKPPGSSPGLEAFGFDRAEWVDVREGETNLWSFAERPHASRKLVDRTIDLLRSAGGQPFYLQLWLNDPHALLAPSAEQMKPFVRTEPKGFTTPFAVYAATVTEMDRQIGRLLTALDELGLAKNTIVVFSSDNGPEDIEITNAAWSSAGSAGPLRGRKRSLYEGGTRVPFLVRWPAGVPAGRVDAQTVVSGADLLPTVSELAGVALAPEIATMQRGESVAAAFRGTPRADRSRPLLWEWRFRVSNHLWNRSPVLAIRDGRWKLLLNPDRSRVELFDIVADPGEQLNIAAAHATVVDRLAKQALTWQATLPPGYVDPAAGRQDYPWPGGPRP